MILNWFSIPVIKTATFFVNSNMLWRASSATPVNTRPYSKWCWHIHIDIESMTGVLVINILGDPHKKPQIPHYLLTPQSLRDKSRTWVYENIRPWKACSFFIIQPPISWKDNDVLVLYMNETTTDWPGFSGTWFNQN